MKLNKLNIAIVGLSGMLSAPAFAQNFYQCMPVGCKVGEYGSPGACKPCPAGEYSDTVNSTTCKKCPGGYYCPGNSDKQACDKVNVVFAGIALYSNKSHQTHLWGYQSARYAGVFFNGSNTITKKCTPASLSMKWEPEGYFNAAEHWQYKEKSSVNTDGLCSRDITAGVTHADKDNSSCHFGYSYEFGEDNYKKISNSQWGLAGGCSAGTACILPYNDRGSWFVPGFNDSYKDYVITTIIDKGFIGDYGDTMTFKCDNITGKITVESGNENYTTKNYN